MRKGHLWGTIPPSPCMAAEHKMKEYKVAAVTQTVTQTVTINFKD